MRKGKFRVGFCFYFIFYFLCVNGVVILLLCAITTLNKEVYHHECIPNILMVCRLCG